MERIQYLYGKLWDLERTVIVGYDLTKTVGKILHVFYVVIWKGLCLYSKDCVCMARYVTWKGPCLYGTLCNLERTVCMASCVT